MSDDVVEIEEDPQEMWSGRKRAWTMRNSAARRMPSRLGQAPVSLGGEGFEELELLETAGRVPAEDAVDQADVIVRQMEQDPVLMRDNPQSEELRKEALRELPQCLTLKRTVRAKISASVSMKSKRRPISLYKRFKYRVSFAFKRLRERCRDFFFSVELWYEPIRTVEGHFGSAVGSYFYFLRNLFIINALISAVVFSFVVLPQILQDRHGSGAEVSRNIALDILSGQGILEESVVFFGHYGYGTVRESGYSIPFAYFFTMAAVYLLLFALLSARTAWSYRRHFIETAGGLGQVYAAKVFCGWDFGIATKTAAANNSRYMYNELKELLSEQSRKEEQIPRCVRITQLFVDVTLNVLVLCLISGALVLFWWLMDTAASTQLGPYGSLAMAAIVTAVLTVGPLIFSRIVRLESYSARTRLYVTLFRSFVLDASMLVLLLVYWFRRDDRCWETMLGQEVYRLVILDLLFSVVLIPLIEFFRGIIYKRLFPDHALEFDLAYNSLCLVYKQTLLLLGMFFSPTLAIIVCAELAVLFYVRRAVVMRACRPARKLWRSAQTQTVLNLLVYLSLLASLCVLGFFVMRPASKQCGPFQQYDNVYQVLTEGVLKLSQHDSLRRLLVFVTRPGVIGLLLLLMCMGAYYARSRAAAHRSMVAILKEMLALEAKDKEFLLSAIAKVSNGEWLYSPRHAPESDSHTYRFLHDKNIRQPSNAGFQLARPHLNGTAGQGRPASYFQVQGAPDGDTDSSFSWQGSTSRLDEGASPKFREAKKRL